MPKVKKGKIRIELFVIAGIIVLALVYLLVNNRNQTHYQLPEVPRINTDNITKLILSSSNAVITLSLQKGAWHVEPGNFIADKRVINEMMIGFAFFQISDLVSESKSYGIYQLDDAHKINIKAFSKDKLLIDFDIGKSSPTLKHTYAKLAGRDEVYTIAGNWRVLYDGGIDFYRDKRVLDFDRDSIHKIDFTDKNGKTLTLSRTTANSGTNLTVVWKTAGGKILNNELVSDFLVEFDTVSCDFYITNRTKESFKKPAFTVQLTGKQVYSLAVFQESKEGFSCISSGSPFAFYLSKMKMDDVYERRDDLVKSLR